MDIIFARHAAIFALIILAAPFSAQGSIVRTTELEASDIRVSTIIQRPLSAASPATDTEKTSSDLIPPTLYTYFSYQSQPGDFIGLGQSVLLTPADGQMTLATETNQAFNSANTIALIYDREGSNPWDAYFQGPAHALLVPGVYNDVTRWLFHSPNATMSVTGDHRGCNTLTGSFTVLEVIYDVNGYATSFAVDFEQHCEGATPALFGQIRYNSTLPEPAAATLLALCGFVTPRFPRRRRRISLVS